MRFLDTSRRRAGSSGFIFDVSGDLDMAQRLSSDVRDIAKAQKRVIGTLRRRLRTEARRDIQREYNLKAQTINERLSVSPRSDGLALVGKDTGINLINFGARQTRVGVSYSVKKGKRETRAHAFIRSTRKGNGPFVWMRGEGHDRRVEVKSFAFGLAGRYAVTRMRGRNSAYSDEHGYPIFQQYGPSVAQMLKHGDRPQRLVDFSGQVIEKELDRLLDPK